MRQVEAVIFDWAGTTVDHGSLAPVKAVTCLFTRHGIALSDIDARRDMGLFKKDHIRRILALPQVESAWHGLQGESPSERDVESTDGGRHMAVEYSHSPIGPLDTSLANKYDAPRAVFCVRSELEDTMRKKFALIAAGMVLAAIPALAHHSFAAEYDNNKPLKLTGKVTKVEWMNPHARFYIDVKDDAGKVSNWEFELGSPNGLMRRGWTRNSLKEGDEVTVTGYHAKDGSNLGNARTINLSDGRKVFAGSTDDGGPTQ